MKIVWRRVHGPEILGITTYEPGDKVKLKNPSPPYMVMGEIKDPNTNTFKPCPITSNVGINVGDQMIVESVIPYDARLFHSEDYYILKHLDTGKVIKLNRVYLDIG